MRILKFGSLIYFVFFSQLSFATDFLYKGKTIDSLCFFRTEDSVVALSECGIHAIADRKIVSYQNELVNKGLIGYDFSGTSFGYSYYQPFHLQDADIVYTINNRGGEEVLTSLEFIKRTKDNLEITILNGGDRCEAGIYDVSETNKVLTYRVNLTAYDFISRRKPHAFRATQYPSKDACAACCKAATVYERRPEDGYKEKFMYVDLDAYANANNTPTGHNACFDTIIEDFKKRGMHHLNVQQLADFTARFNTDCFQDEVTPPDNPHN